MAKIGVLGLGNWGTALAQHLCLKGHDVLGWSIEQQVVDGINQQHFNPVYLPQAKLDASLKATSNLNEVCGRGILVLVVPSKFIDSVLAQVDPPVNALLISAVKGIDPATLRTPLQVAKARLNSSTRLAVISGPSFAKDVVAQRPCGLVMASNDEATAKEAATLFHGESMRVYLSKDPLGVELGGIVKNVIALAVGISDGLDLGDSARAGLITRGLAEMMRLAVAMGADQRTLSGLSGLGDLAMTATSDSSRNRSVGLRLGKGETLPSILSSLGSVAEGVSTAPLVIELAKKYQVEMPITEQVVRLLSGELNPTEVLRALVSRPSKMELD